MQNEHNSQEYSRDDTEAKSIAWRTPKLWAHRREEFEIWIPVCGYGLLLYSRHSLLELELSFQSDKLGKDTLGAAFSDSMSEITQALEWILG